MMKFLKRAWSRLWFQVSPARSRMIKYAEYDVKLMSEAFVITPTPEALADALVQWRTSGMCHYGEVCGLCDCNVAGLSPSEVLLADERVLAEAKFLIARVWSKSLT